MFKANQKSTIFAAPTAVINEMVIIACILGRQYYLQLKGITKYKYPGYYIIQQIICHLHRTDIQVVLIILFKNLRQKVTSSTRTIRMLLEGGRLVKQKLGCSAYVFRRRQIHQIFD